MKNCTSKMLKEWISLKVSENKKAFSTEAAHKMEIWFNELVR